MDINASIVDQRVRGLAETYKDRLSGDDDKRRSSAFLLLCIKTVLDLDEEEAFERLTDGSGDADVDGLDVGDLRDGEFVVTLFQGKYRRDLSGQSGFPANSVKKIVGTVGALFDPDKPLTLGAELRPKVEELRSLVRDGNIPLVRVVLCNNGQRWGADGDEVIKNARLPPEVSWEHVNHDRIIRMLQRRRDVDDELRLHGKAIVEDFNFRRVLIGKIPVAEIKELFDRHGDLLLERNIRRYLGLYENRVNRGIRETLADAKRRTNFYFYNNGITIVCSKFRYNALQSENWKVRVENLQIIHGGQTCKTIQQVLGELPDENYDQTFVLLRLYELGDTDDVIVGDITYATNSQNPVDLRDLKSNDDIQQKLDIGIRDLGYEYKRKRDTVSPGASTITAGVAAEAVLAVWRRKPHQAKFRRSELFGDYYDEIFRKDLNAAQVILAVLIFRMVETERRRPSTTAPRYVSYASYFLAMLVGAGLLERKGSRLDQVDHRNFAELRGEFESAQAQLYQQARSKLDDALARLGITEASSLQRLSAAFRRGDLLEELKTAGYL
ncbi:MAG TPA: AIPR family protein [Candidatus Nanopelagicales bacterium]|nr:AIPR family protein [Candidatus Nanopelagicales bacterium]